MKLLAAQQFLKENGFGMAKDHPEHPESNDFAIAHNELLYIGGTGAGELRNGPEFQNTGFDPFFGFHDPFFDQLIQSFRADSATQRTLECILAPSFARDAYIRRFGFAVPTDGVLALCATFGPLLEVGAGSGYWAYELRQLGVDIVATDSGTGRYGFFNCDPNDAKRIYGRWEKPWVELERLTGVEAVAKYPGRNLLISWPDMDQSWGVETLRAFTGDKVLYVGEYRGCTADDAFHDYLEEAFDPMGDIALPNFPGIHDFLSVWRRKAPSSGLASSGLASSGLASSGK